MDSINSSTGTASDFLEDTLPSLITSPNTDDLRGATLSADYLAQVYPDSEQIMEIVTATHNLYAATVDLVLTERNLPTNKPGLREAGKSLAARALFHIVVKRGFGNPINNRNRAVGLFALAVHKVESREDHDRKMMTEDFRRPFEVSETYNRRDMRRYWLEPYQDKLRQQAELTRNEGLALEVTEQTAKRYTLSPGNLLKN